jgi:hypothetical protein
MAPRETAGVTGTPMMLGVETPVVVGVADEDDISTTDWCDRAALRILVRR